MALDLNADSATDRAKLNEAEQLRRRQKPSQAKQAKQVKAARVLAPDSVALSLRLGTQNLAGLAPSAWLKVAWALGAVFVVAVIILAVTTGSRKPVGGVPSGTIPSSAIPPVPDELKNPDASSGGVAAGTLPGSVTPQTPAAPRNDEEPRAPAEPSSSANSSNPSGPAPAPAATPREIAILEHLTRRAGLNATTQVTHVSVDARNQRVTVILVEQGGAAQRPVDELRATVVTSAGRAAAGVFDFDRNASSVAINGRLADGSGAAVPLFEGEMDRAAAAGVLAAQTPDQVAALFQNVWWAGSGPAENAAGDPAGNPAGNAANGTKSSGRP
jgi:hypothetical protein